LKLARSDSIYELDIRSVERGICPTAATLPAATLTFWGQVTSSVRWTFHSQYGVSYRWSII